MQRAIETLRRHGFAVELSDSSCDRDLVGLPSNVEHDDDWLDCDIHARSSTGGETLILRPATQDDPDPDAIERELENVHCHLLPDEPGAEDAIDGLDAAFAELKSAIRP